MSALGFDQDDMKKNQYYTVSLMREADGVMFSTPGYDPRIREATDCETKKEILAFFEKLKSSVSESDLKARYLILHRNGKHKDHTGDGKDWHFHECTIDKAIEFVQMMIKEKK